MGSWTYSTKTTQWCTTRQNTNSGYGQKHPGNPKSKMENGKNDPSDQIASENVWWSSKGKNDLYSHPNRGSTLLATEHNQKRWVYNPTWLVKWGKQPRMSNLFQKRSMGFTWAKTTPSIPQFMDLLSHWLCNTQQRNSPTVWRREQQKNAQKRSQNAWGREDVNASWVSNEFLSSYLPINPKHIFFKMGALPNSNLIPILFPTPCIN